MMPLIADLIEILFTAGYVAALAIVSVTFAVVFLYVLASGLVMLTDWIHGDRP